MTAFSRLALVPRHLNGRVVEQLLQAAAGILAEGLPELFLQTPHHRCSRDDQLLLGPIQEAVGFPEPFLVGGQTRFFLTAGRPPVSNVICSQTSTNSSANWRKRL